MDTKDLRRDLRTPEVDKLKALGPGIKIDRVMGPRVLVKPVIPYTTMDRLEAEGVLVFEQWMKDENTPAASTGFVLDVGDEVEGSFLKLLKPTDENPSPMVLFSKYSGSPFTVDGEGVIVLETSEIVATLIDTNKVVEVVGEDKRRPSELGAVPFA